MLQTFHLVVGDYLLGGDWFSVYVSVSFLDSVLILYSNLYRLILHYRILHHLNIHYFVLFLNPLLFAFMDVVSVMTWDNCHLCSGVLYCICPLHA